MPIPRVCRHCGAIFEATRGDGPAWYCSISCRFWAKVDTDGGEGACWNWTAALNGQGRGSFGISGVMELAPRVAWSLTRGPIPIGLCVCHSCDNPLCCNPSHLWLGTIADNNADKMSKGRHVAPIGDANGARLHPESRRRGEGHPLSVLSKDTIDVAFKMRSGGDTYKSIAKRLGVNKSTIRRALVGESWAHLGVSDAD